MRTRTLTEIHEAAQRRRADLIDAIDLDAATARLFYAWVRVRETMPPGPRMTNDHARALGEYAGMTKLLSAVGLGATETSVDHAVHLTLVELGDVPPRGGAFNHEFTAYAERAFPLVRAALAETP